MATFEKSAASPLLSPASSFSCRSPGALQKSPLAAALSPSLSPCPSLNASSVIVLLPDDSVRLYEQRISADRVLAEFPNHELRRAGSRRALDSCSHLSSRETYALIEPPRRPPSPTSKQLPQNESFPAIPTRNFSPTPTPPLQRARTTSPERSQSAAGCGNVSTKPHTQQQPTEQQQQPKQQQGGCLTSGIRGTERCGIQQTDAAAIAAVSTFGGGGGDGLPRRVFEAIGRTGSLSPPDDGDPPPFLRGHSPSGAAISESRDFERRDSSEWGDHTTTLLVDPADPTTWGNPNRYDGANAPHFSVASSPLWRQSSLTTYLPSTAAAAAVAGRGFQASLMHGAPAVLLPMAFFDAAQAAQPPPSFVPPPFLDTSAAQHSRDSADLRLLPNDVQFDSWVDEPAADVPTPRFPRQLRAAPSQEPPRADDSLRGKKGGDYAASASDAPAPKFPQGAAVSADESLSPGAAGGPRAEEGARAFQDEPLRAVVELGSGPEQRRPASSSATATAPAGAEESLASEGGAAEARLALGGRAGFVRQRATSGCLDLSSSSITSGGSSGGRDDGFPGGRRSRAGSLLFDEWTDLGGTPWSGGGSGTGKEASTKETERRRPIFHQKTPSGRILQELFDLENGPLDLEFIVSLRTPSRRHYGSPGRISAANSPHHMRRTPRATPPRSPLYTAAADGDGTAGGGSAAAAASTAAAGASDGTGASGAASASAPVVPAVAGEPPALPSADSSAATAPDSPAPAAAAVSAASDDDDEAAAAAASAWAAAELVDGSVSAVASGSRGWIASAARSRFISRIAQSFHYSSLHGRRGLFGGRGNSKGGHGGTGSSSGGAVAAGSAAATGAAAAAVATAGAGNAADAAGAKASGRVGGSTRSLIRRGTMPVIRHEHMATALDGSSTHFSAAATAAAAADEAAASAAVHPSASEGDLVPPSPSSSTTRSMSRVASAAGGAAADSAAAGGMPAGDLRRASTGKFTAVSRGNSRTANSGSATSAVSTTSSASMGPAMSSSSSSLAWAAPQANAGAVWAGPDPSLHDAAWRMLMLQQQKIAEMEAEILELRQRCRTAGLGSERTEGKGLAAGAAAAGTTVAADGAVEVQGAAVAAAAPSAATVYGGLGQFSTLNLRRRLREGAEGIGESSVPMSSFPTSNLPSSSLPSSNLPTLPHLQAASSDERDGLPGSSNLDVLCLQIPSPTSSHSTVSWTSHHHMGRPGPGSSSDNLLASPRPAVASPRISPRPAVAAMGAAAAAAAAAGMGLDAGCGGVGGVRQGLRGF